MNFCAIIIVILFIVGVILISFITYVVTKNDIVREMVQENIAEICQDKHNQELSQRKSLTKRLSKAVPDYQYYAVPNLRSVFSSDMEHYERFIKDANSILDMSGKWIELIKTDMAYYHMDQDFYELEENFLTQFRNLDVLRISGSEVTKEYEPILAEIHNIAEKMKSLMILDHEEINNANTANREKSHDEIIAEMHQLSERQFATGEGDQDMAKIRQDIASLYDLWQKAYSTGMIDGYHDIENNVWNLVEQYNQATRGKGSFPAVIENYGKLNSIVNDLVELAEIRQNRKNKLSDGLELDAIAKVVSDALNQEKT
ncbi:hypothetical protein IKE88_02620 [Candidatus Saccharibacteria bacterium]|nr:hypothetical protein [Candidatus Saccharibacteria bacterium]